jgi:hypothetical protein
MFSDLPLARRLERAEGHACLQFAEARRRLFAASGAEWIKCAGAFAVFDGVDSPVTQTFGLGIFEEPSAAALDTIESFFSIAERTWITTLRCSSRKAADRLTNSLRQATIGVRHTDAAHPLVAHALFCAVSTPPPQSEASPAHMPDKISDLLNGGWSWEMGRMTVDHNNIDTTVDAARKSVCATTKQRGGNLG